MGQIIKPVCICQCIRLWAPLTVTFLDRFTPKLSQTTRTPESTNKFVGVNIAYLFPFSLPPKTPILGQEVLKIRANINNPISALNICKLRNLLYLLNYLLTYI